MPTHHARSSITLLLAVLVLLIPRVAVGQGTIPLLKTPPENLTRLNRDTARAVNELVLKGDALAVEFVAARDSVSVAANRTPAEEARLREKARQLYERLKRSLASRDSLVCVNQERAFQWCSLRLNAAVARAAGRIFWDQEEDGGFTAAKMLNIQGLGDLKSQSTYIELVSDLWNMTRISLGGVFTAEDTTTDETKARQFLNGGGPAVVTLLRPIAAMNLLGSRTLLLGRVQASAKIPGGGESADDSLKFADFGIDVHTQIQGLSRKIGGLFMLHVGRVVGGGRFYAAVGEDASFTIATGSVGLVIEESASLTWTRFLAGPGDFRDVRDLIGVKFTR